MEIPGALIPNIGAPSTWSERNRNQMLSMGQGVQQASPESDMSELAMSTSCGSTIVSGEPCDGSSPPGAASPAGPGLSSVNWTDLVERIRRGDELGMEE